MNRPVRLHRLLQRHDHLVGALEQFGASDHTRLRVTDASGRILVDTLGEPTGSEWSGIDLVVEGTTVGRVDGPGATIAHPWLAALATQAHLERAVGAEVLQLYRQLRVMIELTELLSIGRDPRTVSRVLVDAVARAVAGAEVAFVDPRGRITATTAADAAFLPAAHWTEATIRNGADGCLLAAPVLGPERRFGQLQAVRSSPEFTAAEADLLATLAIIGATALGRAQAHQRDLRQARKRARELEATVERLQSELDLVTTTVLASVLFSDLVDSTATQAAIGDQAWARLIETHNRETSRLVEAHGGHLVDFAGDGFFAWFDTPSRALACAVEHRTMVEGLGLRARAGLHVGEAEQRGPMLSGVTVNAAARIMGRADGGQILASEVTTHLLGGSTHRFECVQEVELKGLEGTWALHRLLDD